MLHTPAICLSPLCLLKKKIQTFEKQNLLCNLALTCNIYISKCRLDLKITIFQESRRYNCMYSWSKPFSLYALWTCVIHIQMTTLRRVQVFASQNMRNSFRHGCDLPSPLVSCHRTGGALSLRERSGIGCDTWMSQKHSGSTVGSSELNAEQFIHFDAV